MEINDVIRDLVAKGMNKEDIISTLNQMGVENAETLVLEALKTTVVTKPDSVPVNSLNTSEVSSSSNSQDYSELKGKLEVLIELNKQILESQRQLLLKLK